MKVPHIKSLATSAFFLLTLSIFGQNFQLESNQALVEKYMQTITADELKEHLYTIASDDFEGRATGKLGQKLAVDYIARHFMENGLEGPVSNNPNPYFQPVNLLGSFYESGSIGTATVKLVDKKDFFPISRSSVESKTAECVILGYGIDSDNYSDYASIDVKGKGVVIVDGDPMDKKGNKLFDSAPNVRRKMQTAIQKGAAFVILTYPTEEKFNANAALFKNFLENPQLRLDDGSPVRQRVSTPIFVADPQAVAKLYNQSMPKLFKTINKEVTKKKPLGSTFSTSVSVSTKISDKKISSENVLGYLPGEDLKNELVVVTAHHDHVGTSGDKIFNGADDDGSGTVGVLEVANAFSTAVKDGIKPRRSILFMTVTGEERGLLGSRFYTDIDPKFPLENTIANINIDMIGRIDPDHEGKGDYVYIIGSNMLSTELHAIQETVASTYLPSFQLDYKYNSKDDPERFYYRSDHYNFAKNNIPVVFYFNGTHEDYHQHTDTPDKIDYDMLSQRARLIFATTWELANRDHRPVVDQLEEAGSK